MQSVGIQYYILCVALYAQTLDLCYTPSSLSAEWTNYRGLASMLETEVYVHAKMN